jgi:hypothetical protein
MYTRLLFNFVFAITYISPLQTFFEHQTAATSPSADWNLSHPNNQLTSPFGILPHESLVTPTSGPPTATKLTSAVTYDTPFATHFNSNGTTPTGADSKAAAWPDSDPIKKGKAQSPISNNSNSIKCAVTESSIPGAHTFYEGPTDFNADDLTANYPTDDQSAVNPPTVQSSLHHQSCIVSTANLTPSNKEYRISQLSSRSPVPPTIYLNATVQEKQATTGTDNILISAFSAMSEKLKVFKKI